MTLATALHDVGDARRPALPIEAALQNVASAAHLRGVEVTRSGEVVGTVPAGELMRALRGAWIRKRDTDRADQVETIIRGRRGEDRAARQRDYEVEGQLGQEATPADFADALSAVGRGVHRVLRDDGVMWLQIGDTYAAGGNGGGGSLVAKRRQWTGAHARKGWRRQSPGFKEKDITLTPFVVADTLRADGWYLRSTIIWNKETATEPPRLDRPSTAHEYLFLLSKNERYAVRDPGESWFRSTVWTIRPQPTHTGHPAVMPAELARRCIVCSTKRGDIVLDPFGGSGTTAMVAEGLQRDSILIELNPRYAAIAERRTKASPLFATVVA